MAWPFYSAIIIPAFAGSGTQLLGVDNTGLLAVSSPATVLTLIGAQAADADLTALAALVTTGYAKRTAANTWTATTIPASDIPSLAASIITSGVLAPTIGGTGLATYVLGDTLYASAANTLSRLTGNISTTRQFLMQQGTGVVSAIPAWSVVAQDDVTGLTTTSSPTFAGLTLTGLTTAGSILFASAGGTISQDGANLYWNDAANQLSVGGTVVRNASMLDVYGQLQSNSYVMGAGPDLSLFPVVGGQSVLSSWHGLQLVGNKASTVVYTPVDIGGGPSIASVIIPNQQAGAIGVVILGQTGQTGNLLEFRTVSNVGLTAFNASGDLLIGSLVDNGVDAFQVAGSAAVSQSLLLSPTATAGTANGRLWSDSAGQTLDTFQAGVVQSIETALFSQTNSVTVANIATENTLLGTGAGTITLPANFFTIGKTIRIRMMGSYRTNGAVALRMRSYLGATLIGDTAAVSYTVAAIRYFELEAVYTCRTVGVAGTVMGQIVFEGNTSATAQQKTASINTVATTINTTISQVLNITALWAAASPQNTITSTNVLVEVAS